MKTKKLLTILFLLNIFCFGIQGQDKIKELNGKLNELAGRKHLPGFAVSIVSKDKVLFQKGYGYSDLESQNPYTINTIQNIGSVSKTFIGVSLMKAVEQGKIGLDDEINSILPFKIVNPFYPKSPITVRHLATHTSTIQDTDNYERTYLFRDKISVDFKEVPKEYKPLIELYNTNKRTTMVDFIKDLATEGGKWYNKENFLKQRPGTTVEYSNLGATLLAYILEIKTGESFDDFSRKHILKPLKMNASGWSFEKVKMNRFASQYIGNMQKIPRYSLITYPDGGLISSVSDMSKYLMEMMRGYQGESKILTKESFREMMSPQSKVVKLRYAICWRAPARNSYIGHTGGDPGTATYMFFSPKNNVGMILFTNYSLDGRDSVRQFGQIWEALYDYGLVLDKKVAGKN